jgi:hypothetical protein
MARFVSRTHDSQPTCGTAGLVSQRKDRFPRLRGGSLLPCCGGDAPPRPSSAGRFEAVTKLHCRVFSTSSSRQISARNNCAIRPVTTLRSDGSPFSRQTSKHRTCRMCDCVSDVRSSDRWRPSQSPLRMREKTEDYTEGGGQPPIPLDRSAEIRASMIFVSLLERFLLSRVTATQRWLGLVGT